MLQSEVATILGVTKSAVWNWESNTSTPRLQYMPVIIRFLGYNPLPKPDSLGDRLVRRRTSLGLSQEQAANHLGFDAGTLAGWECGEKEPTGERLRRVERFLNDDALTAEFQQVG
jgi:transcriptional regulator with XRE-family HTH domain